MKQADELHELGFNAGWNGAIEEAAKVAEHNGWERTAEQIRALAAHPPAAPVETPDFETALRRALDDLTVEDGKCNWAEVANILPRMRGELRAYTPPQRSSADNEPVAWRIPTESGSWYVHVGPHKPRNDAEPLYNAPPQESSRPPRCALYPECRCHEPNGCLVSRPQR